VLFDVGRLPRLDTAMGTKYSAVIPSNLDEAAKRAIGPGAT